MRLPLKVSCVDAFSDRWRKGSKNKFVVYKGNDQLRLCFGQKSNVILVVLPRNVLSTLSYFAVATLAFI